MINKTFNELLDNYIHCLCSLGYDLSDKQIRKTCKTYLCGVIDYLLRVKLINEKDFNYIYGKLYYFVKYKGQEK